DGTTGEQAMAYMQKQTAQETVPEGAGRFAPSPNAGLAIPEANPVADVAKGAGVGLARGALGMVGLPGTVEQLGRMGINYGAQALGAKGEVVSPETALPTGGDLQKRVEKHT